MSHPRPATASPPGLLASGVPPFLLAQFAPVGSWDHVAWAIAAAGALWATLGTVVIAQRRRSRRTALDIPILFAPPAPRPRPAARQPPLPRAPGPARPRPAPVQAPAPAADDFPPDGTLQVLPGRLEVIAGIAPDNPWGQEIRFVCIPGFAPEVTFGRGEGPAHRHVRLASPTVSREQARMRFGAGGWTIRNLSRTNATVVNGRALDTDGPAELREGDRIEMGEVVFRFRER